MPTLRYGGIVGAYLQAKKKGKQLHPAVIVTPDADIIQPESFDPRRGNDNIVVAIGVTTKYRLYNEPYVPLPNRPAGTQSPGSRKTAPPSSGGTASSMFRMTFASMQNTSRPR